MMLDKYIHLFLRNQNIVLHIVHTFMYTTFKINTRSR